MVRNWFRRLLRRPAPEDSIDELAPEGRFSWWLSSIALSSGDSVPLGPGSVLIIIGPNGAGKSTALKDIQACVSNPQATTRVVTSVAAEREGTKEDFESWLSKSYDRRRWNDEWRYSTAGGTLSEWEVRQAWQTPTLSNAVAFLTHHLGTGERLMITAPVNAMDMDERLPSGPTEYLHHLQLDEALLKRASTAAEEAFGVQLMINWTGGSKVWLHAGIEPEASNRVSREYRVELEKVPRLVDEGDGMRSFTGAVLAALCGSQPMLLIDEPEAFLHPPQARRLAAFLTRATVAAGRQMIMATHSADVVRGALGAYSEVAVCRLTRDGEVNQAAVLQSDDLTRLWSRPSLRSSAAVDGLFHGGVVVCEADADCRFYEALMASSDSGALERSEDLYFTHAGGKGQIPFLTRAYRSLKTPTAVVADLDLLRTKAEFKAVFESLGGDFSTLEKTYSSVATSLADVPPTVESKDFIEGASEVIEDVREKGYLRSDHRKSMYRLLGDGAQWSEAKKHGINALSGQRFAEAEGLLSNLAEHGLFLVPRGELESWRRKGSPSDKSAWLNDALEALVREPQELEAAREFARGLREWFVTS